jgi:hypothetical protein
MGLDLRRPDAEPSRHTQMHQQAIAGGELHEQIFGSALDCANCSPLHTRSESRGERITKRLPTHDDPRNASARHRTLQPAACVFDFGQLGHAVECTALH